VLFSNQQVASFLNQRFEPVWEMVRPVPLVRIDFGGGNVLTRTLHGNIASYVCTADGCVVDILPGIYTADVYTASLSQVRTVAASLGSDRDNPPARRLNRLQQYHQEEAAALRNNQPRAAAAARLPRDGGKGVIERRVEVAIAGILPNNAGMPASGPIPVGADLGQWQALVDDTRRNESQRRLLIHDKLAANTPLRPEQIKSWLCKVVLNSDLDDPYLGLGDMLAASDVLVR
jgi:hypothetical protein